MSIDIAGVSVDSMEFESSHREDFFGNRQTEATLSFRAPHAKDEQIDEILRAAQDERRPLVATDGTRWFVKNWMTSFSDGEPLKSWTVSISTAPKHEISNIEMLGISKAPRWSEIHVPGDPTTDPSTLHVEILLDEDEHRRISDLKQKHSVEKEPIYFPVKVAGVSDVSLSARFGLLVWQKTDDGYIHSIYLVSERGDSKALFGGMTIDRLFEPRLTRTTQMAARAERMLNEMIDQLRAGGVLSENAVAAIRAAGEGAFSMAQVDELRRVDDVTAFR